MPDLFTKATKVKTTTKLWVIAIALTVMVNIPFVDNRYQPTTINTPTQSLPAAPPTTHALLPPPPRSSTATTDVRIEQPKQRTGYSSLTGEYSGVVHNQTAALSADFSIEIQDSGGSLSGSMVVKPPLFGGGPLEGSVDGSRVTFAVTNSIGTITFLGKRNNNQINGTYIVEHTTGLKESGIFVLRSKPSVDTAASVVRKVESTAVPESPPKMQPLQPLSAMSAGADTQLSTPSVVEHSDPKNLSYCLNGYVPCNRSLLTPEESNQVAANDRRRNLSYCLNGYVPCNRSFLTPEESAQVAASARRRNLSYCLNGYVPCNRSLLTPEESAQVAASDRRRNLSYCLNGYAFCNPNLLTPEELVEVQARDRQRHH